RSSNSNDLSATQATGFGSTTLQARVAAPLYRSDQLVGVSGNPALTVPAGSRKLTTHGRVARASCTSAESASLSLMLTWHFDAPPHASACTGVRLDPDQGVPASQRADSAP